jgi:sugar lactone lactonase YvrE
MRPLVMKYLGLSLYTLIIGMVLDGDGTLFFNLKNKKKDIKVINYDCKKIMSGSG